MLKKFPMHNYILLLFIVLTFVSIGLPISLSAALVSNTEDQGIHELNKNQDRNHTDTGNSVSNVVHSRDLHSTAGYYFVQTQPESTTAEAETEDNLDQSNSTDNSQISTEDKVTTNSDAGNNNLPPTNTTNTGNLSPKSTSIKCEGSALCVTGEVVKVINGKAFYVNIQNKVYKVELALIGLPMQSEEAMRAATTFTRNTCLGSNVLIDQDDGQKVDSFIAQVYCSPTKHLNSLLLQTGYVLLDKSQCQTSEFSKLEWAKSYGC